MRPLLGAGLAVLLLGFVLAGPLFGLFVAPPGASTRSLSAPSISFPPNVTYAGNPARLSFASLASLDPAHDAFVIVSPATGYTASDVAAALSFLERGGRILVGDDGSIGRAFLHGLGVGIAIGDAHVYSPDFEQDASRLVGKSTDVVPGLPPDVVFTHPAVVRGGTPIITAPPLSWEDANDNGKPDLGEVLLTGSLAATLPVGKGELIVLGDPNLLKTDSATSEPLFGYLTRGGRSLVVDASHEAQSNPLGTNQLLAGQVSLPVASGILMGTAVIGALVVLGPRLVPNAKKSSPPARPAALTDALVRETLQELDRE